MGSIDPTRSERPQLPGAVKPAAARKASVLGVGTGIASATAQADTLLGPLFQQTRITAENYDLHLWVLCGVLVTYCVVFGVTLYSVLARRKAAGPDSEHFHRTITVEIVWTVIPWIILIATAWPAATILARMSGPANADITIKATGLQWKWGYDYLEGDGAGISFFASPYVAPRPAVEPTVDAVAVYRLAVDNPVVVPVDKKIRVVLSAKEEIHSWHIPDLGVKQYAVPGLVRDTWFLARSTGTYRGLCSAEACGEGRACVPVVVNVVSDDDYRKWVDGRKRNIAAYSGGAG